MTRLLAWAAAGALCCAAPALVAGPPAGAALTPVAHSALVTVEGVETGDSLVLRLRRNADQQPLTGAELKVTVGGRDVPVTRRPEGTWGLPARDVPNPPGRLSIEVTHDGVREVLEAQLPGGTAQATPAAESGGVVSRLIHKQTSWWILNVLIVLIGVIAVSRRMS